MLTQIILLTRFGLYRNTAFVVDKCHPGLTDMFVTAARHEYLLSLPLTKEDIKAEALNILSAFQNATEPNSPNGTHYMAQISPNFLARASTRDTDRLMAMLPFQTLSLSGLEGRCQRRNEIVRKRRRNYVVFRRGRVTEIKRFLGQKECSRSDVSGA